MNADFEEEDEVEADFFGGDRDREWGSSSLCGVFLEVVFFPKKFIADTPVDDLVLRVSSASIRSVRAYWLMHGVIAGRTVSN